MYNPLDQFNFNKFLDRVRDLDVTAMLKEADSELYGISYPPEKPKGHKSAAAMKKQDPTENYAIKYMDSLRGFHFFFGTSAGTIKPTGMDKDDFQLLESIVKVLISKNQLTSRYLKFFT